LEGIEIVYGPSSRTFGANAFTGAVNFITKIPDKSFISFDIGQGSFKSTDGNIAAALVGKNFKQSVSLDYSQSDGFIGNTDFRRFSFYYENNFKISTVNFKTMLGFLDKKFGAYNFYTPQYSDQYEKIRTYFAAFKVNGSGAVKWEYKAYYRNLTDQFQLFREGEGFYQKFDSKWINSTTADTITWYSGHNNHLTSVAGSGFNLEKDWSLGKTAIGAEYRYEHIYSNVLGIATPEMFNGIYNKADERQNVSVFAEHGYYSDKFLLNIGSLAYWNQKYNWNFYYGADFGFYLTPQLLLKAGVNKSMRLPTFTELYYQGPSNLGNPNLLPEQAISVEVGSKLYLSKNSFVNLNAFSRYGKNIISWFKESTSTIWKTENLTSLNTMGIEVFGNYRDFKESFFLNNVNVSYAYLYQDKFAAGLESKYTLDHLKHKFLFSLEHKIYNNLSASWSLNVFKRNGEFVFYDTTISAFTGTMTYKTNAVLNFNLNAEFDNINFYFRVYNLTNSDYFDIGNVPTPGISMMAGFKVKL
jgi:iron complex outermembrane receptor protein